MNKSAEIKDIKILGMNIETIIEMKENIVKTKGNRKTEVK